MQKFEIQFEIESRCILRCVHCSSHLMRNRSRNYGIEEMCRLIDMLDRSSEVYFTGGEPLLCGDLQKIVSSVSRHGVDTQVGMFTSGVICHGNGIIPIDKNRVKELKQNGLEICYISLYSNYADHHDYMTGTVGSYECTVQAIENMASCGIDTRINLVVTRLNCMYLEDIISFASSLGVNEVRLLKLVRHGSAIVNWSEICISDEEHKTAVFRIINKRELFPLSLSISSMPNLVPCRPIDGSVGCQAGRNLIYVDLNGNVFPCACVKNAPQYMLGNIKTFEVSGNTSEKFNTVCLGERGQ